MTKDQFIEAKQRELVDLLIGDLQYGDDRDEPKWKQAVIEAASRVFTADLTATWEAGAAAERRNVRDIISLLLDDDA